MKTFKEYWKSTSDFLKLKEEYAQLTELISGQKNYMRRHSEPYQAQKLREMIKEQEEIAREIKDMQSKGENVHHSKGSFNLKRRNSFSGDTYEEYTAPNGDSVTLNIQEEMSMQRVAMNATVTSDIDGSKSTMHWRGNSCENSANNFLKQTFGINR
jgi:uncharacterized membrane protein YdfJ with MMPL/SSD domain